MSSRTLEKKFQSKFRLLSNQVPYAMACLRCHDRRVYAQVHTHTHTYTCAHIHLRTHTLAHTHTHRFTHIVVPRSHCARLRHIRQPVSFNSAVSPLCSALSVFVPFSFGPVCYYIHLFFFLFSFFFSYSKLLPPHRHRAERSKCIHTQRNITGLRRRRRRRRGTDGGDNDTRSKPTNNIDQGYQPYFHYSIITCNRYRSSLGTTTHPYDVTVTDLVEWG